MQVVNNDAIKAIATNPEPVAQQAKAGPSHTAAVDIPLSIVSSFLVKMLP